MKPKKNKKTIIILIVVLVLLILINIIMNSTGKTTEELASTEEVEKKKNEAVVLELSEKGEQKRTEYYLMEFIEAIEQKEFKKAYDMLYDEFKENYFTVESSFREYCEQYFPKIMEVKTNNIERINNIYVLETTITDLINGTKNSNKTMIYFVIRENNLNDFDLSFSVNSVKNIGNN